MLIDNHFMVVENGSGPAKWLFFRFGCKFNQIFLNKEI